MSRVGKVRGAFYDMCSSADLFSMVGSRSKEESYQES